ncbi:MAG: 50S ribosomal protein L20 [Ignavibacteria bacterium]|jgi:large subunit ribosomal protein L20|nr:50S ribosomal protein L20 [Ignavibacteria bacterium]MDH7528765.1 50S ribosomal protein L20 [Ignavibacteria bacterium]NPV10263.1 50S ribosomal protein L20 [Ignavibacteria bacterium]
MPRSKNKVASHRRRKKILEQAKGYWGRRSKVYTIAKNSVEKALLHSYVGRKLKKRQFRSLWITRINAAARMNGTTYSKLISALKKKQVGIDRKLLASIAYENPQAFSEIVKFAMN